MSRKPGHDKVKIETILYALRTSPHGSWVRDIAKKTGLKKSTVAHYLKEHLKDQVEVVHDSKHIKIIKLKQQHPAEEKHRKKMKEEPQEQEPQQKPDDEEKPDYIPDYIG